jgi:hypothetical protein
MGFNMSQVTAGGKFSRTSPVVAAPIHRTASTTLHPTTTFASLMPRHIGWSKGDSLCGGNFALLAMDVQLLIDRQIITDRKTLKNSSPKPARYSRAETKLWD